MRRLRAGANKSRDRGDRATSSRRNRHLGYVLFQWVHRVRPGLCSLPRLGLSLGWVSPSAGSPRLGLAPRLGLSYILRILSIHVNALRKSDRADYGPNGRTDRGESNS